MAHLRLHVHCGSHVHPDVASDDANVHKNDDDAAHKRDQCN